MAEVTVRIPKLAMTTEEGTPTGWLVPDGGMAVEGQPLYSLETDKVETEVDAPATGQVQWTAVLGESYPVGTEIGSISVGR